MGVYDDINAGFGVLLTGSPYPLYIQATDLDLTVPVSGQTWTPPYRESQLVVVSKRHLHNGTISGFLIRRNADGSPGTTITARRWAKRLQWLVKNQALYTIRLKSHLFNADSVKFPADYGIVPVMSPSSANAVYRVTLPFVQVD